MNPRAKRLLLNFLIELLVYGTLLAIYFWAVLQFLNEPLNRLFHLNNWVYAGVTLLLIVVQAVFLESVTAFLLERLGLERLE